MKKLKGLLLIVTLLTTHTVHGSEIFPVFVRSQDAPVSVTVGKEQLLLVFSSEPADWIWEFIEARFSFQMGARKEGNQPLLSRILENIFLLDVAEGKKYPIKLRGEFYHYSSGAAVLTNMPLVSGATKTFKVFGDLTGEWRTGDTLTVGFSFMVARDVSDKSLWAFDSNRHSSESVLAVENPNGTDPIQKPGATITAIGWEPNIEKGGITIRLAAQCNPGPYLYMAQGTKDFVRWFNLGGSTVNQDGKLSLELWVPNESTLKPPPSGGGLFIRLRANPFP